MTTKCDVCEKWGKPAADFWEEMQVKPTPEGLIAKAQDFGESRPDFIGAIAGSNKDPVPEWIVDIACGTARYDLEQEAKK